MNKWDDNALYRGVLVGFITLFLGSCVLSSVAVQVFVVPAPCLVLPLGAWLLAGIAAIAAARWSRKRDLPEVWVAQGRCAACGYDLTGNVSGKCPECGTIITRQPEGPSDHS